MPVPVFPDVPRDARGHLMLRFHEAVLALVCHARGGRVAGHSAGSILEEHPFLQAYVSEALAHARVDDCGAALAWLRDAITAWERHVEAPLPMCALRHVGLDNAHLLALVLCGLVEEDPRFGALFAAAQGSASARRPSVALLGSVVAGAATTRVAGDAWTLCGRLVDAGLADVLNPGDARADWQLRVPVPLWTVLCGDTPGQPLPGVHWRAAYELEPLSELVATECHHRHLREAHALLASGAASALILRGLPGSLRMESVHAIAHALGSGVLEVPVADVAAPNAWRLLGPLATMLHAMPAFVLEAGPGDVFQVPAWPGCRHPVAVILGHDGGVAGAAAERAVSLQLEPDPIDLRRRHWQRALPDAVPDLHDRLAARFLLGGASVRRAAELAGAQAALDGRTAVSAADVQVASRSINRQQLDSLAARLAADAGWERLVLHPSTAQDLLHLERRCRFREQLTHTLGDDLPGGINRGVRALFQGPSGTGKTLAARVLACELGLDIYRVDLASIVSKYIGETEKNLSRIFGRAEDLDVILLLDEGDSLMGRRTQVRSSNDRWANLETNYMLQRLEGYTGIVFVTTNSPGSIDTAFQRRMDSVVRFHMPTFEERWSLWQQHLPATHAIDADELHQAALRCELTGGQIRNAAIDATLHGFASGDGLIGTADFTAAIDAEYRKAGASSPRPRSLPDASHAD
ncbi:MAG TPA: ATP-binding protein, partial [Longimicrobiales bacterium]|nr:ATP-binding protein [Longimicrobiales bacterium]